MPITQSAEKALRQSKKRHVENLRFKRNFKAAIKEFRDELGAKNFEKAKSLLPKVYQAVDKATKKNVLKKNTASRYKSRLTKSLAVASAK
ncbi:MAG: 30S ribosomal protein S20 [bacterium]|nr:30S ribosomal protein S20 [bacterium]